MLIIQCPMSPNTLSRARAHSFSFHFSLSLLSSPFCVVNLQPHPIFPLLCACACVSFSLFRLTLCFSIFFVVSSPLTLYAYTVPSPARFAPHYCYSIYIEYKCHQHRILSFSSLPTTTSESNRSQMFVRRMKMPCKIIRYLGFSRKLIEDCWPV